ncbi:response regulator [Bacteriovoracaceae bacterium]|nr:response regulator [Bacteriovoracaceae bacterium]
MKKILIIEDDQVMRENTAEILELANFKAVTAENGKAGYKKAKEEDPDLIICDIMMPEIDGYGVLHLLSKDPSTASIPFIFLTAKAEKSEVRQGMELGADDYITKPYDEMELLRAIEIRFKKNELIKKNFSDNLDGLNQFIEEAKGNKELEALSQDRPKIKLKKKTILYHSGDTPQYLYFLASGKVKTFRNHDDGKEYVTDIYKQNDFFGLNPLFEKRDYRESAITLEDSEVCKIPRQDFMELVYKNRDVAIKFIKILSRNLEDRERQLLSMAYDTVRKRAAEALLDLEKRFTKEESENTRIKITRDDLASMVGTASETVIRCLSEFKEDGFIAVEGRDIIILDSSSLSEIRH